LVMTSGNVSDEPICYDDEGALNRLSEIADYFLLHDRPIHRRADDSIARVQCGRSVVLRRSRGYAPLPIKTGFTFARPILACGAELKNTFCLTRKDQAFLSHHIGDLENLETLESFHRGVEDFKRLFNFQPEVVAYDLHPEYLSTKYALALDDIPIKVGVQHHHAHIASCMAENNLEGEVIGVAMDGLGFGTDGRLWGGEFFVADFVKAERVAHLEYIPMPGGTKAIREPWRMAAIYLHRAFGDEFLRLNIPFVKELDRRAWSALRSMVASRVNSPETSSMGRLFDAASSLLGISKVVNYEGQAAVALEAIADPACLESYEFQLADNSGIIRADAIIQNAVADLLDGISPQIISAKFHQAVVNVIVSVARRVRGERQLNRVVLSGGVFQNSFITERVYGKLCAEAFEVFIHSRVPPNDGGIALGQAVIANAQIESGSI
jgi:hydrogenase maturation protein HypF